MDQYQSTSVSFVPKLNSLRQSNQIIPMNGQQHYRNNINQWVPNAQKRSSCIPAFFGNNIASSSNMINSSGISSRDRGNNPSIFATLEHSSQFKNSNAKDADDNRRRRRLKAWLVFAGLLLTLITLAAVVMSIYLLIIIETSTTTNTSVTTITTLAPVVTTTPTPAPGSSNTGSMNFARYWHTASILTNGKVLVAGGDNSGVVYLASAELYDPSTGVWTTTGSMNFGRCVHTASILTNGKVLVAGGGGIGSSYLASVELYQP